MGYEVMGAVHALGRARVARAGERGQGTVEYVGLILLVAVIARRGREGERRRSRTTGIAEAVVKKLKGAIDGVGERTREPATAQRRRPRRVPDWRRARARPSPEELRRRPVGVFDSGVGGLTVLHELLVQLPHEDFVYLADSARFPYGDAHAGRSSRRSRSRSPRSCSRAGSSCSSSPATRRPRRRCPRCASG